MKQLLNTLKIAIIAVSATISTAAASQVNIKPAIAHFEAGEYTEAIAQLEQAAIKHDRDAKINYYLGASYVCIGRNLSEGARRLKFAQIKGMQANSNFYLGRAYQLQYEFELASQTFEKYLRTAKDEALIALAKQYKAECVASVPLASKIFSVRVIDKYRVTRDSILTVYNPSREVGMVQYNSDFFESDVNPNGILYRTERGDAVYFSLPNDAGHEKLYKIERLLDGWGEMTPLQGLQSAADEKMPILMTDGVSLYFSSNREGGMGGFDIYRTTYDAETRTFSTPVNLGVPFNSAADDYLFVADEFRTRAWFASNRETSADSVMVYEILWDNSVIRNFAQSTEDIRRAAALNIDKSLAKMRDDFTSIGGAQKATASITKEQKKFEFVVNDSLTYTQWEHFRSAEAKETFREALNLKHEKDSLSAEMAKRRKQFMNISDNDQRNELISGILTIERRVYTLEDNVNEKYATARRVELQRLMDLIESGEYQSLGEIDLAAQNTAIDWAKLLNPNYYMMYDRSFFVDAHTDDELYSELFSADDQRELQEADSLYAWAEILSLEKTKFEEFALQGKTLNSIDEDGNPKELSPNEINERSILLDKASTTLLHRSFDTKYDIFDDYYEAAREREPETDFSESDSPRTVAVKTYARAEGMSKNHSDEAYKNAALIKKSAINNYRKALVRYSSHKNGSFPLPAKVHNAEPASVAEALSRIDTTTVAREPMVATTSDTVENTQPENQETVVEERPHIVATENIPQEQPKPVEEVQSAPTKTTDTALQTPANGKPIYRIQLGAFKSSPDQKKLAAFSDITTYFIPEKKLTKYYVGSYRTYDEAIGHLNEVRTAGFTSAFVVAFASGEQIKLSEAQKLE